MSEKELKKELLNATEAVDGFVNGSIGLSDFIETYSNFYHYNALDGHEGGLDVELLIKKYRRAVMLHSRIQAEVLDLIYIGDQNLASQYKTTGRILSGEAKEVAARIVNDCDISAILSELRGG